MGADIGREVPLLVDVSSGLACSNTNDKSSALEAAATVSFAVVVVVVVLEEDRGGNAETPMVIAGGSGVDSAAVATVSFSGPRLGSGAGMERELLEAVAADGGAGNCLEPVTDGAWISATVMGDTDGVERKGFS